VAKPAASKTTQSPPAKTGAKPAGKPTAKPAAKPAAKPTPDAKPAGRKSSRGARKAAPAPSGWQVGGISTERKLDFVGILLALTGLLTLLSLVSGQRGSLTGWWISLLGRVVGWGVYLLPPALIGVGIWLILRNVDRLPAISAARLSGITLFFLNLLAWLHLIAGGGWELARQGVGGGYLGALGEMTLVAGLGRAGAIIALLAWLLIAIVLTLDLSVPELFRYLRQASQRLPRPQPATPVASNAGPAITPGDENGINELPPDFNPLPRPARPATPAAAAAPAPAGGAAPVAASPTLGVAATPAANSAPAVNVPAAVPWTLPAVDAILELATPAAAQSGLDQERAHLIEETLASFGAPAHVVEIHHGPTITQYGVEPDFVESRSGRMRVRVSKIVSLADDLALALAAPRIRIQAPVPGRGYVGIEVPNTEISRVALREVLESESFNKLRSPLRFALGKDVSGKPIAADLAAMPHLLIAGTTGSGKSVCVNAILTCLLLKNTPDDLRLVLVDPKRVELTGYNGIPHLLSPVVVEAERVIGALQWMMREMDNRYHKFSQVGARNIQDYNARQSGEHLPYLVVIIDELADLMMLAPDETERSITRLAQLARATGIHLILATQRPSVDVVTGLIKANFPARIAFAVASGVDSRVILDQPGAERLLGRGDMLFQAPDAPAPARLQGVYVSDGEIQRLVDTWRLAARPASTTSSEGEQAVDSLPRNVPLHQAPLWKEMEENTSKDDPLLKEAIDLVRREGRASVSMLQRRMRIGYTRAARLVDVMEERSIVGPPQGATQVREVLDYGPAAPPAGE